MNVRHALIRTAATLAAAVVLFGDGAVPFVAPGATGRPIVVDLTGAAAFAARVLTAAGLAAGALWATRRRAAR